MSRLICVTLLLAAFLCAFGLSGCSGDGHRSPLEGTVWGLEGWSINSLNAADFEITAAFKDGQISGKAAVNSYSGPYTAASGGGFSLGGLSRTEMAGPEPAMRAESTYFALLGQARSYDLNGGRLTLLDAKGNELLIFVTISGAATTASAGRTSTKGWELYSWQEDGRWAFSLLEGTNRLKTVGEIRSPKTMLDDIDALGLVLESLAAGQWVTWWDPSWAEGALAFPPANLVERVRTTCEERGLQLMLETESH